MTQIIDDRQMDRQIEIERYDRWTDLILNITGTINQSGNIDQCIKTITEEQFVIAGQFEDNVASITSRRINNM